MAKNTYQHKKFIHDGSFPLGDGEVIWREKAGGEIEFKSQKGNKFKPFSEFFDRLMKSQPLSAGGDQEQFRKDTELAIVNQLLAYYRPYAVTDTNGYYAASAGISADGHLVMAVNNEKAIVAPFAGRGCAETAMLRKMDEAFPGCDVQMKTTYLMSGMRSQNALKQWVEKEPGHVSCLCGECRQNLRKPMAGGRFIMVPTNDGTQKLTLNTTATTRADLSSDQAWEIPYDLMYPLPEFVALDDERTKIVQQGFKFITDPTTTALPLVTELFRPDPKKMSRAELLKVVQKLQPHYESPGSEVAALQENASMENINRTMVQLVKDAYETHKDTALGQTRNVNITAVVLKIGENPGKFYASVSVDGTLLPSKPPPLVNALTHAKNQMDVQEVYMMTFDAHQLRMESEGGTAMERKFLSHQLAMPDPASIGRVLKNTDPKVDPKLWVIPLNDGSLSSEEVEKLADPPLNLREAFGPGFSAPKQIILQGVAGR